MIDFPQMISTSHINAQYFFDRDVNCVATFFRRRFGFIAASTPTLADDTARGLLAGSNPARFAPLPLHCLLTAILQASLLCKRYSLSDLGIAACRHHRP